MDKEKATLGRSGAFTADSMCAEYTTPPPARQHKRTLKSLISSRGIRAYLLEREEHVSSHPDADCYLLEAIRIVLDATELREISR
jgi:hypothetical protein